MLKATSQQEGTTVRERYLAKLAKKSFFGLWSYPSLFRDEGISKNGIGQELADLTVIFGNVVILFSEKDIAWPNHSDLITNWGRWYRKSVTASAKQLYGAEQFITNHPGRIFLDKFCREKFPINIPVKDLEIHLIAVTNNTKSAAEAYLSEKGEGSIPSLMCNFLLTQKSILEHPFFVTDISPEKTFIHVFDEITLDLMLYELDTISDFIHYLNAKENAIRNLNLSFAAGEEEILGYYLQERSPNGHGDIAIPRKLRKMRPASLMIPEGEWALFQADKAYQDLLEIRKRAALWSILLNRFSNAVLSANTGEANDVPFEVHELAVRCMASENRLSRALLSDALFEKFNEVPTGARSARLAKSPFKPNRLYIFLFFPHRNDVNDYSEYRKERRAAMQLYAFIAKYKFPEIKEILVLGADPKGSPKSSETALYVDVSAPLSEDEKERAKNLMISEQVLDTVPDSSGFSIKDLQNMSSGRRRYGRNDPCICGSGMKNKKCCNYTGPITR